MEEENAAEGFKEARSTFGGPDGTLTVWLECR